MMSLFLIGYIARQPFEAFSVQFSSFFSLFIFTFDTMVKMIYDAFSVMHALIYTHREVYEELKATF